MGLRSISTTAVWGRQSRNLPAGWSKRDIFISNPVGREETEHLVHVLRVKLK